MGALKLSLTLCKQSVVSHSSAAADRMNYGAFNFDAGSTKDAASAQALLSGRNSGSVSGGTRDEGVTLGSWILQC